MEILYLSHNRRAFTETTLEALRANTEWAKVSSIVLYDDGSTDGTADLIDQFAPRFPVSSRVVKHTGGLGGPVACMNDYITTRRPELFAKIDSDTMVPRGWLGDCLDVMDRHPWLDLLGIEPFHPVAPGPKPGRMVVEAAHIGGIGLMRGRAFDHSLPRPDGRFGFTSWQQKLNVRNGWLNPALPVFLLDRMPVEPWASLSREYVANGWQREWPAYTPDMSKQWEWFTK